MAIKKKTARKRTPVAVIPAGAVENLIFDVRGVKVMVDADLAAEKDKLDAILTLAA